MYKFENVFQAVGFFSFCNPARARYLNIFEPERGSQPVAEHFSGDHPHDTWASICKAIEKAINYTNSNYARDVFSLYFPSERDSGIGREEIANKLHLPVDYVSRILNDLLQELERELVVRELIPPTSIK